MFPTSRHLAWLSKLKVKLHARQRWAKALQMHHGHSLTGAALKSGASVQPAHSRRMHTQNHTLSGDSSDLTAQSTFSAASFLAWSSNSWQQVAHAADSSFL